MTHHGMTDTTRVGIYGLTYKENIDDMRESPTLQMLQIMDRHLAGGMVKVYDPFILKDVVPNQYHNLDAFLDSVDLVVIMVGHDEIKSQMHKLENKIVLDTRHICPSDTVYRL